MNISHWVLEGRNLDGSIFYIEKIYNFIDACNKCVDKMVASKDGTSYTLIENGCVIGCE